MSTEEDELLPARKDRSEGREVQGGAEETKENVAGNAEQRSSRPAAADAAARTAPRSGPRPFDVVTRVRHEIVRGGQLRRLR